MNINTEEKNSKVKS